MPMKPKTACGHPGCPELIEIGEKYCDKHKALHADEFRPSAGKRGYDSRWNRFRKDYLNAHPLCVECMKKGRYVKATDVDHIKAVRDYPELKYELSNLQALCHSCHSQKTNRADHYPVFTFGNT